MKKHHIRQSVRQTKDTSGETHKKSTLDEGLDDVTENDHIRRFKFWWTLYKVTSDETLWAKQGGYTSS